jgi:hypothetical protein
LFSVCDENLLLFFYSLIIKPERINMISEPILIALIGILGAIVGSVATIAGNVVMHFLEKRAARKREEPQRKMLEEMLNRADFDYWRKLDTMMRVIGADESTTKRLLIEIHARGSETEDGKWALMEKHPILNDKTQ